MRISKSAILEGLRALYPDARPELNFRNPYETLVADMIQPGQKKVLLLSLIHISEPTRPY